PSHNLFEKETDRVMGRGVCEDEIVALGLDRDEVEIYRLRPHRTACSLGGSASSFEHGFVHMRALQAAAGGRDRLPASRQGADGAWARLLRPAWSVRGPNAFERAEGAGGSGANRRELLASIRETRRGNGRSIGAFLYAGGVTVDELCQWMVPGVHGGQAKTAAFFSEGLRETTIKLSGLSWK